ALAGAEAQPRQRRSEPVGEGVELAVAERGGAALGIFPREGRLVGGALGQGRAQVVVCGDRAPRIPGLAELVVGQRLALALLNRRPHASSPRRLVRSNGGLAQAATCAGPCGLFAAPGPPVKE